MRILKTLSLAALATGVALTMSTPGFAQLKTGGGGGGWGGGGGGGGVAIGGGGGGMKVGGGPAIGGGGGFRGPVGGPGPNPSRWANSPGAGNWAGAPRPGRGPWVGGPGRYPRHHHHRGYGWGPGFAVGALVGSGLAASAYYGYPYDDYYYDESVVTAVPAGEDEVAYCSRRFKSYDPASGTYLGYDGKRHPCP